MFLSCTSQKSFHAGWLYNAYLRRVYSGAISNSLDNPTQRMERRLVSNVSKECLPFEKLKIRKVFKLLRLSPLEIDCCKCPEFIISCSVDVAQRSGDGSILVLLNDLFEVCVSQVSKRRRSASRGNLGEQIAFPSFDMKPV